MFVLMSLMFSCLQRARVLFFGAHQPLSFIQCAQCTTETVAYYFSSPIEQPAAALQAGKQ